MIVRYGVAVGGQVVVLESSSLTGDRVPLSLVYAFADKTTSTKPATRMVPPTKVRIQFPSRM